MIHFYDKSRKLVMELSDFSFDNGEEQKIRFSSSISYAFYKALLYIEDYSICFENFLYRGTWLVPHRPHRDV